MIVGISGKKCSGKNTVADYLINLLGGEQRAFADPLKREAYGLILRLTGEETDPWHDKQARMRRFLQVLGTELMRAWSDTVWVELALMEARECLAGGAPYVYLTDCRFPNEAEAIQAEGGIVIRVICDAEVRYDRIRTLYGAESLASDRLLHASETALDDYLDFNFVVDMSDWERALPGLDRVVAALSNPGMLDIVSSRPA